MALHVLQLGPYPPPEGGVSRNMISIRDELLRGGHQCTIVATTKGGDGVNDENVYRPSSPFSLLRLLRHLRYDILHLHIGGEITARVICLAAACTLFARGRSVLTLHSGGYPDSDKGRAAKSGSLRGAIFRRFSRIIAVNEKIADVFRRYGVPDEKISVILPFSLQRPDGDVVIPESIREFYQAHSPILLAVGGLEKDYDPLFQVGVMKNVLAKMPEAGLVIVGSGSMESEVKEKVAESGYTNSIRLAGNVEHAVTLRLIDDADVLMRTTLFDGDAIAVREALFLGTPVIATDNGMRPDGVHLIAIGDSAGLVEKLNEILTSENPNHALAGDQNGNIGEVIELYKTITRA